MSSEKTVGLAPVIRAFHTILDGAGIVSGVVCGALVFILCYEVVMRYLFHSPTSWDVEVGRYLLLLITFLAAAYTLKEGGHINVDMVITRLPATPRTYLRIVTTLLSLFYCGFLTWDGASLLHLAIRDKWMWDISSLPTWPVYALIPIGGLLLCLECIVQIWCDIMLLMGREVVLPKESE